MKNRTLIAFIVGLLLASIGMYFFMKGNTEYVDVPVTVEVPVPVFGKDFDTIFNPKPIPLLKPWKERVIDSTYYQAYLKLKDSIARDSAYKDAITIREYRPTFEDDTIKIDVYSKVRGTLLESQVSYQTKPFDVKLDTIIRVPIPKKPMIFVGATALLPRNNNGFEGLSPSLKPSAALLNKSQKGLYTIQTDFVNKSIEVGYFFKF